MLNEPDLQPDAVINRWIQGIEMFTFELVHVPAERHKGPDALSRRPLGEGEVIEEDDDSWLDEIALMTFIPYRDFPPFPKIPQNLNSKITYQPQVYATRKTQENTLNQIYKYLTQDKILVIQNLQAKRRFLNKTGEFFIQNSRMYKKNRNKPPLLVIFDGEHRNSILLHAHENLGHRGVFAVYEVIRHRFYWPRMRADVNHHVKSCHECQIRSIKRLEIPLTISVSTRLFAKVYIDIMHIPAAHGFHYIVAAKDDLSGTSEAIPLRRATAKALAKFFLGKYLLLIWSSLTCCNS